MSTENNKLKVIEQLDNQVLSVIGNDAINGFQKAFLVADATGKLKDLLSKEYMEPIMNLQGNRLGFKTDKDRNGGYDMTTVKNCLIEAVLMGVQPVGNQFNIIAGNTYITKEGFGYLLSKLNGLWYEIIPELPRINQNNTSAAIVMNVNWSVNNGDKKERKIEIPIKVNSMMGTDAIIGKATRKSRAWLYNTITGCEVSDGDISDLEIKPKTIDVNAEIESEETNRILGFIEKSETLQELKKVKASLSPELKIKFENELENRENELILNEENK